MLLRLAIVSITSVLITLYGCANRAKDRECRKKLGKGAYFNSTLGKCSNPPDCDLLDDDCL